MRYFETIKCKNGKAYNLKYHNQRIFNTIGKVFDLEAIISPPNLNLYRCKIIYTKDSIEDINYYLYKKKEIKSFKFVYDNSISYKYKYLNRDCFNSFLDPNYDEIIIVKNGLITDTSIANIAILVNNSWLTPKKPLLYGTTRERYIKKGILKEADITVDMFKKAKQIATLNAMVGFNILK